MTVPAAWREEQGSIESTVSMVTEEIPVLAARGFSKTFAGRTVLRDVDLDVLPGEVHGLVGQNGSGKSTFIKILAGYHAPDPGASLRIRGEPVPLPLGTEDPSKLGISFVHQDLGLFELGSVLENLRVGRYETGFAWRISWRRERQLAQEALARFGLDLDPDQPLSSLPEVERAMVAIIRALERVGEVRRGLLVLDEPTAYLPRDSVDRLFATIRRVAATGFGVLFVTHRLEEVFAITDRVTILRDGHVVDTASTSALTESDLVARILGFLLDSLYPEPHRVEGEAVLVAREVSGAGVRDFSLELRRGEVVGLTGLLGMGHERVPYLLFGAEPASKGSVWIDGREWDLRSFSPFRAIASGLALLPGNRLRDGGVGVATARENITLPTVARYLSGGFIRDGAEKRDVLQLMDQFQVNPGEPERLFATFSGGNQQKGLVAKWFATQPKVLLLHEPTHGVDVGARQQIFRHIRSGAEQGMGILISSVDYEDLAHLCDRVIVFRHGQPSAELHGADLTRERILERCYGPTSAAIGEPPR